MLLLNRDDEVVPSIYAGTLLPRIAWSKINGAKHWAVGGWRLIDEPAQHFLLGFPLESAKYPGKGHVGSR
jgi:hypothetical protein